MKNNKIPSFIKNFSKSISTHEPVFIPVRPLGGYPLDECVNIVKLHIVNNGGEQYLGWRIHVWRKVLIEAEFHCIWKTPENALLDISPKTEKTDRIIFLPDPAIEYVGRQIDNIRKPLTSDKNIAAFISVAEESFREFNKGDLADYHGEFYPSDYHRAVNRKVVELKKALTRKYGERRSWPT